MPSSAVLFVPAPGALVTREVDPLTTHREESWRFDLLDFNDETIGTLDNVTGGSFTYSIHNTIRGGGSLDITGTGPQPDWHRVRIRPWYVLDTPTGELAWPMGVFLPTTPGTDYGQGYWSVTAELYDKLHLLDRDEITYVWGADVGENPIDVARGVIQRTARDTKIMMAETAETLSSALAWDAGATGLRIVNDLLAAANYFSLTVDRYGVYRADPYVRPEDRGIAWRFVDDKNRIHLPEFSHESDGFRVPNEVHLVAQQDGAPALESLARNNDPASKWSAVSRGGWITRREDVEATSQAVLDNMAARRLAELSQAGSTFEVQHAWIPLELNDVVPFQQPGIVDTRCVVEAQTVRMYPGDGDPGVTTTLREVAW